MGHNGVAFISLLGLLAVLNTQHSAQCKQNASAPEGRDLTGPCDPRVVSSVFLLFPDQSLYQAGME
eukprot:6591597-Pyramimonas_sp.AAC.1